MKELKPCPFCGGDAVIEAIYDDYEVRCTDCGNGTLILESVKGRAIDAWNTRTGSAELEAVKEYVNKKLHYLNSNGVQSFQLDEVKRLMNGE